MLACPWCDAPAMTNWRKAFLGPGRSIPCRRCQGRVSVSWRAMVAIVPFAVAMALVMILILAGAPEFSPPAILIGYALWVVGHLRCPLVRR